MTNIRINELSNTGFQAGYLSHDQCQKLHNYSLEILSRTGVRLFLPEAVELLRKAGAFVSEGNRVRIPAGMVEKAFSTVPRRVTLYNRHGKPAIYAEDQRSYFGTGSDCLHIVDHRTNQRRDPVLQDIVDGITVCDALPYIDFVMSMFLPTDVNPLVSDRYQMEVMLNKTTKPVVFVTNEFSGALDAVKMAEIVAGGAEALQLRPNVCCYINVTTGLRHNEEALQKLLFLAEKGLPSMYIPVVMSGTTGPVTQAGSVALVNAGVLAGLVLSQLKREGAPYIFPGWGGSPMDMRTMVSPYTTPNWGSAASALANFYNMPDFGLAGCSDSKMVDLQAAAEAALTLLGETLGGSNIIHDLGYLESGLSGSLVQLVLCNEMVGWIQSFLAPMVIDDETVPLDLIDEIGPDGQYIDAEHTLRHFREHWYPAVFDHSKFDQWMRKGGNGFVERATQVLDKILSTHQPEPLPDEVRAAVHAVVEHAEAQFKPS